MISYTLQITDNVNKFPKRVRFTLVNRMQDKALLMYEHLLEADSLTYSEELTDKEKHLRKVKVLIEQLSFLIELSYEKGFIEDKSCSHWSKLIENVQSLTDEWLSKLN